MSLIDATLRAQIRQTENLIEIAGRELVLHRKADLIDDGAGGKKRVANSDDILPVKRYYFGGLQSEGRGATTFPQNFFTTSMGTKYSEYFVLIGMPDDDIRVGDWFMLNDHHYDVLWQHGDVDQYQLKFTVGLAR